MILKVKCKKLKEFNELVKASGARVVNSFCYPGFMVHAICKTDKDIDYSELAAHIIPLSSFEFEQPDYMFLPKDTPFEDLDRIAAENPDKILYIDIMEGND